MSPLEAKEYGIIDHIIGGEEAVFNVRGSMRKFPAVREEYTSGARRWDGLGWAGGLGWDGDWAGMAGALAPRALP